MFISQLHQWYRDHRDEVAALRSELEAHAQGGQEAFWAHVSEARAAGQTFDSRLLRETALQLGMIDYDAD